MTNYLTADEAVCDFFRGVLSPVDVRDEEGRLLGHFTPHVPPELLAKYERIKASIDIEELQRIAREAIGRGSSLEEIWKRIHAAEKSA